MNNIAWSVRCFEFEDDALITGMWLCIQKSKTSEAISPSIGYFVYVKSKELASWIPPFLDVWVLNM